MTCKPAAIGMDGLPGKIARIVRCKKSGKPTQHPQPIPLINPPKSA
jgi:hypothetical protein